MDRFPTIHLYPTKTKAPYTQMCEVGQNSNDDAIFKDTDSIQSDVVSCVISVGLESRWHLEVLLADSFLDALPMVQPLLPQMGVAHGGVEVDTEHVRDTAQAEACKPNVL